MKPIINCACGRAFQKPESLAQHQTTCAKHQAAAAEAAAADERPATTEPEQIEQQAPEQPAAFEQEQAPEVAPSVPSVPEPEPTKQQPAAAKQPEPIVLTGAQRAAAAARAADKALRAACEQIEALGKSHADGARTAAAAAIEATNRARQLLADFA